MNPSSPTSTKRLRSSEELGQSLPLIVVMFVVLCGFVGLTIDVGYGLLQKRRLQAAVDLGLLSGARVMPNTASASTVAGTFVRTNFSRATDQAVTVSTSTGCMLAGCASPDRLSLTATTSTPTFFVRLFGVDEWTVRARGAACGPCDSSPVSYDVIVVLDRSNSMCTDGSGNYNGCSDLANAKTGIRELLDFFDPATDRVSLAVLGSSDTNSCTSTQTSGNCPSGHRPYSHTRTRGGSFWTTSSDPAPCDSANPTTQSGRGIFYQSLGDFMDGTAANHDQWVVVPLGQGTNFKNANGSLNENSSFLNTLDCIQGKGWTPIAPAISESRVEMASHGRTIDEDGNPVYRAIVYFGDGGGTSTPVRRDSNGDPTTSASWYTWSANNRDRPCADAIAQSQRAWTEEDVHVYTIGYALNEGTAQQCRSNSGNNESPSITARTTLQNMAQGDGRFYEQQAAGDVRAIFQAIGHAITAGGTRLVE